MSVREARSDIVFLSDAFRCVICDQMRIDRKFKPLRLVHSLSVEDRGHRRMHTCFSVLCLRDASATLALKDACAFAVF